ncbi:MAG TPA: YihY/virulence factor BrkB family protein [Candidatus Limnocylindrales bacterium]|nr:YihY/virulence factor BrkB family protein [Candidatus Limnocylindrales bacterium]
MLRRVAQDPARADPRNAFRRPFTHLPRRLRALFLVGHRVGFGWLNHDGMSWSAAMAFWLVLSLPPLVIAVSSVAVRFMDDENAREIIADQVVAQLPAEGDLIRQLVEQDIALVSIGGFASLVFLLFSGSRVFSSMVNAIYVMWRHVERASFVRREGMRFVLAGLVGSLLIGSVIVQVAVLGMDELGPVMGILVNWVLPFVMVLLGLFVTYKLIPRNRASFKTAFVGALLAALGLRLAQLIFTLLLGTVLEFDEGYGPLAEVALLATWAFFACAIILLGAELVATLDRHRLPHLPLPSSKEGDANGDDEYEERAASRMG